MAKAKETSPKYVVVKDTREQKGWDFEPKHSCLGTRVDTLNTGDYTLDGYQKYLVIERKANTGEWASNIFQARFEAELERMKKFRFAFIVLEFTMADIIKFPEDSTIPPFRWKWLKVNKWLMLKRTIELMMKYPTVQFVFAGSDGKEFALSLFKRITEQCPNPGLHN